MSNQEGSDVPILSSTVPDSVQIMSQVRKCALGVVSKDGPGQWLAGKGQLNHSMGLECREVSTLAPKATIPSKGFCIGKPQHSLPYIV